MRRRMMMNKALPYDAEIEYLESYGNCYINTGVRFTADMEITCTWSNAASGNYAIYGCNNGESATKGGVEFFYYNAIYQIVVPYSQTQSSIINAPTYGGGIVHHSRLNREIIELDDWSYVINIPDEYYCTRELFLFATNRTTPYFGGNRTRIYAFSILQNGSAILDLIPVRKGNVGYMYDKVSGQLFGNAGTGQFILGPDVNSVNTITQNQQRQMYE